MGNILQALQESGDPTPSMQRAFSHEPSSTSFTAAGDKPRSATHCQAINLQLTDSEPGSFGALTHRCLSPPHAAFGTAQVSSADSASAEAEIQGMERCVRVRGKSGTTPCCAAGRATRAAAAGRGGASQVQASLQRQSLDMAVAAAASATPLLPPQEGDENMGDDDGPPPLPASQVYALSCQYFSRPLLEPQVHPSPPSPLGPFPSHVHNDFTSGASCMHS